MIQNKLTFKYILFVLLWVNKEEEETINKLLASQQITSKCRIRKSLSEEVSQKCNTLQKFTHLFLWG